MVKVAAIYVAGAWSEQWKRARPAMDVLRARGMAISYDWTVPEGTRSNSALTSAQRQSHAVSDLRGVYSADALLLLAPQEPSQGAWVELGIAISRRHTGYADPLIVIAGAAPHCIFAELADKRAESDEEAIEVLLRELAAL